MWQNGDSANHRVVSVQFDDTAACWQFRSQSLRSGDSVVYTFDSEGVYEYFCRIHGKGMCGAVLVGDVTLGQPLPCEISNAIRQFHILTVQRVLEEYLSLAMLPVIIRLLPNLVCH